MFFYLQQMRLDNDKDLMSFIAEIWGLNQGQSPNLELGGRNIK